MGNAGIGTFWEQNKITFCWCGGLSVTRVPVNLEEPARRTLNLEYHHIGIPTTERRDREGERRIEHYATFVSGYETSAYGIEWMRFEPEAPVPELVRTVPHVAFEVDDLSGEIAGKEILIAPNSPSPGGNVAFIVENGVPVEFLQFN